MLYIGSNICSITSFNLCRDHQVIPQHTQVPQKLRHTLGRFSGTTFPGVLCGTVNWLPNAHEMSKAKTNRRSTPSTILHGINLYLARFWNCITLFPQASPVPIINSVNQDSGTAYQLPSWELTLSSTTMWARYVCRMLQRTQSASSALKITCHKRWVSCTAW